MRSRAAFGSTVIIRFPLGLRVDHGRSSLRRARMGMLAGTPETAMGAAPTPRPSQCLPDGQPAIGRPPSGAAGADGASHLPDDARSLRGVDNVLARKFR